MSYNRAATEYQKSQGTGKREQREQGGTGENRGGQVRAGGGGRNAASVNTVYCRSVWFTPGVDEWSLVTHRAQRLCEQAVDICVICVGQRHTPLQMHANVR